MSDTLRSDRLILRRLTTNDATHLARLLGDDSDSVQMMARMPDPCTEEAARHWITMRTSGDAHAFAIIRAEHEEFIGSIGFGGPLEMLGLGYWIGRQYWGQGYATEAVRLIVDFARSLGGVKLQAETFPNNPASARVLDKAGFKKIGVTTKKFPARGGLREVYQHELALVSEARR